MSNFGIWITGLLAALPPAPRVHAEEPPRGGAVPLVLSHCTTDYARSTLLGAVLPGVLQDCLVRPGDRVKAGQVLGRIQDREARAEMELRRAQAESDVDIRLKEAKHERTQIRLKASESLHKRNMMSYDMYTLDRLDETIARLDVENAKLNRRLAQLQLEQSKATVGVREIVATHDGVVVMVFKHAGEAVTPVMPIFQVVDPDSIQIVGSLDVQDATRVRSGQPVRVSPVVGGADLEIESARFTGRITFVNVVIDAKTQTCRVIAEVDNHEGKFRAGLSARMEILPWETTEAVQRSEAPGSTTGRGAPAAAPTAPPTSRALVNPVPLLGRRGGDR
jgi:HlyD family secretion protein